MSARSELARKCFAEFLGVFILCTFGNGSVAEVVITGKQTFLGINMCYGLAVTMAVIVTGKVSGGHINPAVSFAEAIAGRLKWSALPFYIIAQVKLPHPATHDNQPVKKTLFLDIWWFYQLGGFIRIIL